MEDIWKGSVVCYGYFVILTILYSDLQAKPTAPIIRSYLHKMEKLVVVLKKYGDDESVALMMDKRAQLEGMLQALGLDDKGKSAMERE